MEKRRRARINESLGQLKTLIMDALKKDVRTFQIKTTPHISVLGFWGFRIQMVTFSTDWLLSVRSELQTLQTGEGGHPGDDGEASPEPPEGSDDR